jgi:hypothetical protein
MLVVNHLIRAVRGAAVYNPEMQVPPACIIWPDRDRQWEAVVPRLQNDMPELFVLGEYHPEKRSGPAIWLRCAIAGKVPAVKEETKEDRNLTPILYLPGVSRQELRDVENCPEHLKPLVELQYRGIIWSQLNAKDWTILAFLKSDQGGLGLDVSQDNATKSAMQLAISLLLDEEIEFLRGKHLGKDFFNTLLTGGDPVRELLRWLEQGEAFRTGRGANQWQAFVEICKSQFVFNPEKEGLLAGAVRLANHEGPWQPVWERFCEAPFKYPGIPNRIRQCSPPDHTILWLTGEGFEGWPQWNDQKEKELLQDLLALQNMPSTAARQKILELEKMHHARRGLVWAELGDAPLALALKYLAILAETTSHFLAAGTVDDLAAGYLHAGWKADEAVIKSLASVDRQEDLQAVSTAISALYLPWAQGSARHLQKVVEQNGYPGGSIIPGKLPVYEEGTCLLFIDGLRLDMARKLAEKLSEQGLKVQEKPFWAALPTITATCKPAVAPVRDQVHGREDSSDFEPMAAESGQSLQGGYHFKKLLEADGWQILDGHSTGTGEGRAWCEGSNMDRVGHSWGWKLAKQVDNLLQENVERISDLLSAGWKVVHVVTDHGWLLMPGGLPKIDLPAVLVENKWGRYAVIKPGAVAAVHLYPWFWNPYVRFTLAEGICCYRQGMEYTHGGLSLQESLILELVVTGDTASVTHISVEIIDMVWRGLRCKVAAEGSFPGLQLDVRMQAGDPASSVVFNKKEFNENGIASVVVENEDLEGKEAALVVLNREGELVAQVNTVIGGGGR